MTKTFDANDTFYALGGIVILGGIAAAGTAGIGSLLSSLFCAYLMLVITNGFVRGENKKNKRA